MSTSQGHHDDAPPPTDQEDEGQQRVLDQFHSFPFSSDEAFRQGLCGILAHQAMNQTTENERSQFILKTKVFYFNRVTGHNIRLEDVQGDCTADLHLFPAQTGNETIQTSSGAEHGDMRVLSFAELQRLIEQGRTDNIPNNKIIPDCLNSGAPSESSAPLRRKPWELASRS